MDVTRTEADDWIVLDAFDQGYGVKSGDVFRWSDSFCSQMVKGLGPRIAPSSDSIPVYRAALIGQQVEIGAYSEQSLIELMGRLLMTGLENDLKAQEADRRAERAKSDATKDELTGLFNRRGWEELLAIENDRCRRYGHPAYVLSIDLTN